MKNNATQGLGCVVVVWAGEAWEGDARSGKATQRSKTHGMAQETRGPLAQAKDKSFVGEAPVLLLPAQSPAQAARSSQRDHPFRVPNRSRAQDKSLVSSGRTPIFNPGLFIKLSRKKPATRGCCPCTYLRVAGREFPQLPSQAGFSGHPPQTPTTAGLGFRHMRHKG